MVYNILADLGSGRSIGRVLRPNLQRQGRHSVRTRVGTARQRFWLFLLTHVLSRLDDLSLHSRKGGRYKPARHTDTARRGELAMRLIKESPLLIFGIWLILHILGVL